MAAYKFCVNSSFLVIKYLMFDLVGPSKANLASIMAFGCFVVFATITHSLMKCMIIEKIISPFLYNSLLELIN